MIATRVLRSVVASKRLCHNFQIIRPPYNSLLSNTARNSSNLAWEEISSPNTPSSRTAVVMHGIVGSRKNWRTFTRRLSRSFPEWRFLLVDHRGHGDSPSMESPHTVEACAGDVRRLIDTLGIMPDMVLGHSFGGKVALAYLESAAKQEIHMPKQTWVLDALPGSVQDPEAYERQPNSVRKVIDTLTRIPVPIASRDQLVEKLLQDGFTKDLALWMTTNLHLNPDGSETFLWDLDFKVVDSLFSSFLISDYWRLLKEPPSGVRIDFVRAEKNTAWTDDILERFEDLAYYGQVTVHTLENSGHWVHIDKPNELFEIVKPSFA